MDAVLPRDPQVREVLESKELGEPKYVQGTFGFTAPDDPKHRLWDPALGGGTMLDIGVYLVQAATMVFGATMPDQLASTGTLTAEGVDADCIMSMTWNGKGSASFITSFTCNIPMDLYIYCSKGSIKICGPAHCPSRVIVYRDGKEEVHDFELPKLPEGMKAFYGSEGMLYEVQGVEDCIQKGLKEAPEFPLEESLVVARIMDAVRKQVGVEYKS